MSKNLISPKEVLALLINNTSKKTIFVDVRNKSEYNFSRIPGTINIPLEEIENQQKYLAEYDKIILQCTHGSRSKFIRNTLLSNLCKKIFILEGGITEWKNQGYTIQYEKKSHISISRQLHLFSGFVFISGLFLYKLIDNTFFLIPPIIISIGLINEGLTNKCLATRILIKMPWNK